MNAIAESSFERRYIDDQASPALDARILLEHEEVILRPPACFHPTAGEIAMNSGRSRGLL